MHKIGRRMTAVIAAPAAVIAMGAGVVATAAPANAATPTETCQDAALDLVGPNQVALIGENCGSLADGLYDPGVLIVTSGRNAGTHNCTAGLLVVGNEAECTEPT